MKALLEMEGSQVDPRTATHTLVDDELRGTTRMVHLVMRLRRALRQSLVGDIDRIVAILWDIRHPMSLRGLLFRRLHLTAGTHPKRLVTLHVHFLLVGEACGIAPHPDAVLPVQLLVEIVSVRVIVDDHLVVLDITLPRQKNGRTGILQHGGNIGQDIS